MSAGKEWISIKGDKVSYFGKLLSEYKYENPIEFLTDVILVSGRQIDEIPIQSTADNEIVKRVKTQAKIAIARAKTYKSKGGNDPLNILKLDNRSYDVIVRYRQLTQYEGEANEYEGEITLLKNRSKEILETRLIKGTCGC